MCGRFVRFISLEQFIKYFGLKPLGELPERYNIAPSEQVPAIRISPDGSRQLCLLRWGLIPSWAKEPPRGLINARSETVSEKPSFRHAFKHNRCIIPTSGFYEWQKNGDRKTPYYIHMANNDPMAFAGIWDAWRSPQGEVIESCAILTTSANDLVAKLHDRMPVILQPETFDLWLDPEVQDTEKLAPLLSPYPAERITSYRVSAMVNSPANDSSECIDQVTG